MISFNRQAIGCAVLFGLTGVLSNLIVPLGEAPDEGAHIRYAEYIGVHGALPDRQTCEQSNLSEGFQAPLYHVLIAGLVRITGYRDQDIRWVRNVGFDGTGRPGHVAVTDVVQVQMRTARNTVAAYHVLRLPNAIFAGLAFWLMWFGARRLGAEPVISLMAVGLWASTPGAMFTAGVVGNDMLTTLFCALAFVSLVRAWQTASWRDHMVLALTLSLALMTKMTAVLVWGACAALLIYRSLRTPRIARAAVVLILPLVISGWSVVRSLRLHERRVLLDRVVGLGQGFGPYVKSWIVTAVKQAVHTVFSAVGVVGADSVYLPGWVYGLYFGLALVIAVAMWRSRSHHREWFPAVAVPYLFGALGLFLLSVHWFRESGESMASRLYYPFVPGVISVVACLWTSRGWKSRTSLRRSESWLLIAPAVCLIVLGLAPSALWNALASRFVSWGGFGMPAEHYTALLSRGLTACGVALMVFWLARRYATDLHSALRVRPALFAAVTYGSLWLVNVGLLVFYVRRFYT